jgi:hypothetical protein
VLDPSGLVAAKIAAPPRSRTDSTPEASLGVTGGRAEFVYTQLCVGTAVGDLIERALSSSITFWT